MNTAKKFKICDKTIGCLSLIMLASGIQLEASGGVYAWSVWVHIFLGLLFTALCIYHIYLHYKFSNWFSRFAKNRNIITKILWWVFLLTVVSGIAVTIIWVGDSTHSILGGIHGKIGFLMIVFAVIHTLRHKKSTKKSIAKK